jgi:hypothetical protein
LPNTARFQNSFRGARRGRPRGSLGQGRN